MADPFRILLIGAAAQLVLDEMAASPFGPLEVHRLSALPAEASDQTGGVTPRNAVGKPSARGPTSLRGPAEVTFRDSAGPLMVFLW